MILAVSGALFTSGYWAANPVPKLSECVDESGRALPFQSITLSAECHLLPGGVPAPVSNRTLRARINPAEVSSLKTFDTIMDDSTGTNRLKLFLQAEVRFPFPLSLS